MIVARAPYRVSFFGGGTDFRSFYVEEGGAVLSVTLQYYVHFMLRARPAPFVARHRMVWKHVENVAAFEELLHPAARATLLELEVGNRHPLELHYQGDLPARSGMGSSSAFVAALTVAVREFLGQPCSPDWLHRHVVRVERDLLGEAGGEQDQLAITHGGLNLLRFSAAGYEVVPMNLPAARLEELSSSLMLVWLGTSRLGTGYSRRFAERMFAHRDGLRRLRELAFEAVALLESETPLVRFGELLDVGWREKKAMTEVAPRALDVYEHARLNGAVGGKLLGAGGSGFLLLFVAPDRWKKLADSFGHDTIVLRVPFETAEKGARLCGAGSAR